MLSSNTRVCDDAFPSLQCSHQSRNEDVITVKSRSEDVVNIDDCSSTEEEQEPGILAEDREILEGEGWLSDRLVDAGQKLIKQRFPHVGGFQCSCLGQRLRFKVPSTQFVQVLHTGADHWVTISTLGCVSGEVNLFDSLGRRPTKYLEKQIATLLRTSEREITVRYICMIHCAYNQSVSCI